MEPQLNRKPENQWAPSPKGPKHYMKFVTWDAGLPAFQNNPKDRAQAHITVYLIEKFEVQLTEDVSGHSLKNVGHSLWGKNKTHV